MDEEANLGRELRRLAEGVSRLVREHLDLARTEIKDDARRVAANAALGVLALPFLLVAHILLSVAAALGIARALGGPWAFALVGGGNLLVGAALGWAGIRRMRGQARPRLAATSEELQRDRQALSALGNGKALPQELAAPDELSRASRRTSRPGSPGTSDS